MKKNILVVDDSALMRRVICDIINAEGTFQAVDVCRDGLEAYEKLKKQKYDGVVLDVNMPRMDGLQLLEKLQQEKIKATVIMVSTVTTKDAEVTILAMERGAVDFVTKPTNVIEAKGEDFKKRLIAVLSAVLHTERYRKEAASALRTGSVQRTVTRKPSIGGRSGKRIVALACSTGGPKALQSVILIFRQILMRQWFWYSICRQASRSQWQTDSMRSVRSMLRRRQTARFCTRERSISHPAADIWRSKNARTAAIRSG